MKIAFLFSGQGAQYPGMMKSLFDSEEVVRNLFAKADDVLGRGISNICFEGTQEELNLTRNTQPCMLAGDIAAALCLKEHGIKADAVAGFSLGEYAALAYAGAISIDDAFRIIQVRANAMQDAVAPGDGAMAAFVGATTDTVEEICSKVTKGYITVANYNSPLQSVVSGETAAVDEACEIAASLGLRCVKLAVSAPFHCAMMKPAAEKLGVELEKVSFMKPDIPIYFNVSGECIENTDEYVGLLVKQAMSPVRWVQTLTNMQKAGIDTFIECGAGKTLSGLVKKTLSDVKILRVEDVKTLQNTLEELKK